MLLFFKPPQLLYICKKLKAAKREKKKAENEGFRKIGF